MSFQPVIPMGGYAGWVFLKRTAERQQAQLQATPANQRDEAYFKDNIAKVRTAGDLVADRRLLRIALTAFGLEADLNAGAFVGKLLSDDPADSKALANRLADKRYLAMAQAFGLGKGQVAQTTATGFADRILAAYRDRSFEAAIGAQDAALRLSLNAERSLATLAGSSATEDTKWFTIMGDKPLRAVIETAFGLPAGFGQLDIDQQLKSLKSRAQTLFGSSSVAQFSDPAKLDQLIRNYLLRDQIKAGAAGLSPTQTALQLLSR